MDLATPVIHVTEHVRGAAPGHDPSPDVAALTRGMVKGDESAYRVFYESYFDRLTRYLLVVTHGNEETTREALQATLMRVVRHVRRFPDDASLWSWLTVLARSALADESRKQRRYLAFLDRFTTHSRTAHDNAAADNDADARLWALLERHVQSLSAKDQELVERKYFARRSVRDIASELEITEKAVESRLSRIRAKLKSAVLGELRNESHD